MRTKKDGKRIVGKKEGEEEGEESLGLDLLRSRVTA